MIGQRLTHYEILEEISRGGMGIVYRARDLKLNREVALKVLPPDLVSHEDRRRRFLREAQAAAVLNHPNIATVFEIDEVDGITFIVMELIRGEKLSDVLARERVPPARAVRWMLEVSEGLMRAHEGGIVHRDLKPGNVMIGENGQAKIIDFGLAKLLEPFDSKRSEAVTELRDDPLPEEEEPDAKTQLGRVMGTLSYMSPEQAHGRGVDHRSDIFSFGVVSYEMLTGELPFRRHTSQATLDAIVQEPAPELHPSLAGHATPRLQMILDRCLAKKPSERYRSLEDLLPELRQAMEETEGGAVLRARGFRRWAMVAVPAVLVALIFVGILARRNLAVSASAVPRLTNPVQLTSDLGVEDYPAWSPDGRTLAYHSNQSGNWDIWVTRLGTEQPLNRTADFEGLDQYPSWSPDGTRIAFWSAREGGGAFVLPALAGPPRKVSPAEPVGAPQWTSDGSELMTVVLDEGKVMLEVVSVTTGKSRRLPLAGPTIRAYDLALSPSEALVAYVDTGGIESSVHALRITRLTDDYSILVTDGRSNVWSPSWSPDGTKLFYVSNRGGSMDLWQRRIGPDGVPVGEPLPVTTGIGIRSAFFSPDGSQLVYSQGRRVANLWRVPILEDRPATWSDAVQLTFDQGLIEFVTISPDGEQLWLSSDRAGNFDIWILAVDGGDMIRKTFDWAPEWNPRPSPDGRQIAFYSYRSGNRDVWVMPFEGGEARNLTVKNRGSDVLFDWSPDGAELAFISDSGGNFNVWTIPPEGGESRQLTSHPAIEWYPQYSPDGEWLAFDSLRSGDWRLWRVPARGGDPEQVTEGPGVTAKWSPDGTRIYFVGMGERADNIWMVFLEDGSERAMTDLTGRRGNLSRFGLANDGDHLYFAWEADLGDIWVMDVTADST